MPDFTGISRATWSNYENENTEPSLVQLVDIAKFFRISIDVLLLHDIPADVELIEKLQQVNIRESVKGNVKGFVEGNYNFEDLILNDSGQQNYNSAIKNLIKQVAEMRQDINKLKAGKK